MAKEYNEEICKLTHKQIEDEQRAQRECLQRLTVIAEGQEKRVVAAERTLDVSLERQRSIEKRQGDIEANVDELRQKPAKRWDGASEKIVDWLIVAGLMALLAKNYIA